jgi:hypothetical protein
MTALDRVPERVRDDAGGGRGGGDGGDATTR